VKAGSQGDVNVTPFAAPEEVKVLLQDFDRAVQGNWTSGLLCDSRSVGRHKTRICSEWLEQRGFETTIVERAFDAATKRTDDEPFIGLCGFDAAEPRTLLEDAGFDLVIECGLWC
jgi:hypothetical protein